MFVKIIYQKKVYTVFPMIDFAFKKDKNYQQILIRVYICCNREKNK